MARRIFKSIEQAAANLVAAATDERANAWQTGLSGAGSIYSENFKPFLDKQVGCAKGITDAGYKALLQYATCMARGIAK